MARQRKRNAPPFPTFCSKRRETDRWRGLQRNGPIGGAPYLQARRRGRAQSGRDWKKRSLLQLALERVYLLRERDILGHQRLDLAHGVQNGGVITSAEPASDLRQRTQR